MIGVMLTNSRTLLKYFISCELTKISPKLRTYNYHMEFSMTNGEYFMYMSQQSRLEL